MRAGGSLSAYPSMLLIARSTTTASAPVSAPRSTDIRRKGRSRRSPNHAPHGPAETVLSSGNGPMNPGHDAPNPGAPNRCSEASARPNDEAAAREAAPGSTHSMASIDGSAANTSGTGAAPASRSHSRPAASASKKPSGGEPDTHVLVNSDVPSSKVNRDARATEPPETGVSRMR
jgi:hypothetical protein